MTGLHLTADLSGCDPALCTMTDAAALRALCSTAVDAAGLHRVGALFHAFDNGDAAAAGVTGMVLLAESHVAVHTWPESGSVTLDIFVCNRGVDNTERAEALLQTLLQAFAPAAVQRHALRRGAGGDRIGAD